MHIASPPHARGDIVFEICVLPGRLADVLDSGLRNRRAAQIGMQNHARGVDNGPQRRREQVRHLIGNLHRNGPRFWHGHSARKTPAKYRHESFAERFEWHRQQDCGSPGWQVPPAQAKQGVRRRTESFGAVRCE